MTIAMSRGGWLLWVALPYVAIATFVVGTIWRYRHDQFTWTTRSTQLLEGRWLKLGSPLFHIALLAVIGGHVIGILVPKAWTDGVGISEDQYRIFSATMGTIAGLAMLLGLGLLIVRRVRDKRVRGTTSTTDVVVLVLLAFMVATGMWNTSIHNLIQGGYDYRETVSPWFRGLFLLNPDPGVMTTASVPLSYQLHAIGGWVVILIWPFTRLVHAWSVPIGYLWRRPIVYRSRAPLSARVGSGGLGSPDPSLSSTEGPTRVQ